MGAPPGCRYTLAPARWLQDARLDEGLADGAGLSFRGRRHRRAWQAARASLEREAVLHVRGQIVLGNGVPYRQEPLVERERLLVVPGLHGVPELDAEPGQSGQDRRDGAVGAEGEG